MHDRSPGRHTSKAQACLGLAYEYGAGVGRSLNETVKWYRKSAEAGYAVAQLKLGAMYKAGNGVEKDVAKAVHWTQLAAVQGFEEALTCLNIVQHLIPAPSPGTTVTTILLTSAKAAEYNNRTGRVVEPTEGAAIKPGRAAVLLDGEGAPISFKLMNLQIHR